MSFSRMDILRNTRHETSYTYVYENEILTLVVTYDEYKPHGYISTIRDHNNDIQGEAGFFNEMWPNININQQIELRGLVRDAWLQWICSLENSTDYIAAVTHPLNNDLLKAYVRQIQTEGNL